MGRTVGQRIAEARAAAGLTQPCLAELVGVKQQQVSSWERGTRIPDRHRPAIAEALRIKLTDLLTWIADEERRKHDVTRGELSRTLEVVERFVNQYEDLGHTYRSLDETAGQILAAMGKILANQAEILKALNRRPSGRPRT